MKLSKFQIFSIFILLALIIIGIVLAVTLTGSSDDNDGTSSNSSTTVAGLTGKFIYEKGEGVVGEYDNDITAALKTWDGVIKDDVKIDVAFYAYSSNDDTLAFAFMNDQDDIYSGGVVYINTYNRAGTSMKNIIEHEIGHVLGIGTSRKWVDGNNSSILEKGKFPNTYDFYTSWEKRTPNKDGVPLGANGYHFSEEVFDIELMTPFSEKKGVELPISGLTLNALKDIGWNVDLSKADELAHFP